MIIRWIFYLFAAFGCAVFYAFSQSWVSWLLLVMVGSAPWLSLLISLVPVLLVRPALDFPDRVVQGQEEVLAVGIRSVLPQPPCRCRFHARHTLTGETLLLKAEDPLPLEHCGALDCHCSGFVVYDYLGMFPLKRSRIPDLRILIRPRVIPARQPQDLEQLLSRAWKPKYGGGFAENHEMRLYRPGDSLNQVHWKLTAKTGKLIVREPMVPQPGRVLLTMDLSSTPQAMDRKLGQLLWVAEYILDRDIPHEIHALTGAGLQMLPIHSHADLDRAIDTLLTQSPATTGSVLDSVISASWQYHIGGEDDEV